MGRFRQDFEVLAKPASINNSTFFRKECDMKKMLFVALAALGFVACDNSDLGEGNAYSGEVETSYMAINLNAVDNSTRAADGVYQEGDAEERVVNSAYFFFFNTDGSAFPVTATSGPATAPAAEGVNWVSAVLTNKGEEMPNVSDVKNAVLVLSTYEGNYPSQMVAVLNWAPTAGKAYNIAELDAATGIQNDDKSFVMSNAVYSDGTKAVVGTPITESDIFKDEANAKANPVTIYVERIAAKVTVTAKNDVTDNRFKVTKPVTIGGSNKDVYVQVKGWELYNDFAQSYLLKNIDPTWSGLGFTWNDKDWYRCYWATSLPFSEIAENSFPTTFSLAMGNNTNVLAGEYTDNTYTYVGENTNYALADASKCTKVILKAQLQEMVSEGNYKPLALARWYSTYYAGEKDLRTAVASTIKFQYYWWDEANKKRVTIGPDDLQIVEVEGTNTVKFQLSTSAQEESWFTKSGETYTAKTPTEMNELLGGIEKAVYYESGETLYSVDIAHLGYKLEGDQLGDYGVVRNHIYNVVINKFGGFGSPVYTPTGNLDYPDDPTTAGGYVSAEVHVLSWRLVSQEVDVQP